MVADKGKGKVAEESRKPLSARDSAEPPPLTSSSEEQHWHSVNQKNCPVRYRDLHNKLPRFRSLHAKDVILLLTPLVPPRAGTPDENLDLDPYEYLGRALLSRHQGGIYVRKDGLGKDHGSGVIDAGDDLCEALRIQHEKGSGAVAHVPYTNENKLTSTHRGLMRLARFVLFVVNNDSEITHPHVSAAYLAALTNFEQFEDKPEKLGISVVLTNNTPGAFELFPYSDIFPTVIQTQDYSKASLDAIAGIIFGEIRAESESPNLGSPAA